MFQKDKELFMDCLGYRLFCGHLENLDASKKQTINTINQYSYCMAEEDLEFKKSLEQSDVLLPDGVGIVYAARMLEGKRLKKIAGADLHEYNLKRLNKSSGKCFYLGSSQKTLDKIVK
ncbi:MAG: WecB/TagA/CpsF family glycosyltransferase, partial [Flavobacteriaceae bacterium]